MFLSYNEIKYLLLIHEDLVRKNIKKKKAVYVDIFLIHRTSTTMAALLSSDVSIANITNVYVSFDDELKHSDFNESNETLN